MVENYDLKCWVTSDVSNRDGTLYAGQIHLSYPLNREGYLAVQPPETSVEIVGERLVWHLRLDRKEAVALYKALQERFKNEKGIQG